MNIMASKTGDVIKEVVFTNLRSSWKERIPNGSKLSVLVKTEPEFIAHLIVKANLPDDIQEIAIKMYKQVTPNSTEDYKYRRSLITPNVKEESC